MNVPTPPAPTPIHRPWWQTTGARLGFIGAVPVLTAVHESLGGLALLAALVLVWMRSKSVGHPWRVWQRICATVGAIMLCGIVSGIAHPVQGSSQTDGKVTPVATESSRSTQPAKAPDYTGKRLDKAIRAVEEAGYSTGHHDASEQKRNIFATSGWEVCFQHTADDGSRVGFAAVKSAEPCPEADGEPVPWPTMPDVVGKSWKSAHKALIVLDVNEKKIRADAAYANDSLPKSGGYDQWTVCAQEPRAGGKIESHDTVTLDLTAPANDCPSTDVDYPRLPDRDHDGTPDYRDQHDDRRAASSGSSSSSDGNGGRGSSDGSPETSGTPPVDTGHDDPASGGGSSGSTGGGSPGGGSSSSGGGSSVGTVHPGAFCSPVGATGVTSAGTPMVCGPAADNRNRWHSR